MINNVKIRQKWMMAFFMLFVSVITFAQNYTDEEIGLDINKETLFLQKRNIVNSDEVAREIDFLRTIYTNDYISLKKSNAEIFEQINSRRLLRAGEEVLDVSDAEKEALKALYDSTNGKNWTNKLGWDFSKPVTSWDNAAKTGWYGVTVSNGQITALELAGNKLTGFLPAEIGQLKNLLLLNLNLNALLGPVIPEEIGNLVKLQKLALSNCKFSGSLPKSFYNLKSLKYAWLDGNEFSGTISPEIQKLTNLVELCLRKNKFSGEILPEIGLLSKCILVDFGWNEFTGSIPMEIWKMTSLASLNLHDNKLTGVILPEIGLSKKLNILYLHHNQLSGTIPSEIENLYFQLLYLDGNFFEGEVPNLRVSTRMYVEKNNFRFSDLFRLHENYKKKTAVTYTIAPQNKTDTPINSICAIGSSFGMTMYEDDRFSPGETFQWYKNGVAISNAVERTYKIADFKVEDAGIYTCKASHTSNPGMSPLVLEREPITLSTTNCIAATGTIKNKSVKCYTNTDTDFSFESSALNLTYKWSVTNTAGEISNPITNNTGLYSYKFTKEGNYKITLNVTDQYGCESTFTENVAVTNRYCAKEAVNFKFETTLTKLNYKWSAVNSSNTVVHSMSDNTGSYKFTPDLPGEYEIKLTAGGEENCETLFSKKIIVENCLPFVSCTKTNAYTAEIQKIFINLINKLSAAPAGTDVNLYAGKEIAALSPYTTNAENRIYNFSNTAKEISFSFSENAGHDVKLPKSAAGIITEIDLSKYDKAGEKTAVITNYSNNSKNANDGYVQNINFCPNELSCVSHVALVIDESGSIDPVQAGKIKKQLKSFVLQQAMTNDRIGSNIYVSITGMSDSDENTRTDFLSPVKLTNNPLVLNKFYDWINNYGNRNGKTGISASSDYWRSGLEGSLSYTMKPNIVLMITDGCQTADVTGLKTTMKKFNNAHGSNPALPHLYVAGIEKGFYVDENFYVNKTPDSDPNTNPGALVNTVATHLSRSLKFLLDFPDTEFPMSDINQFGVGTYYAHSDFNLLASDETYFSDKLIDSEIVCGTASIKDFCDDCLSFKPEPGKEYVLSAWIKEEIYNQVKTYENAAVKIVFYNNKEALDIKPQIIDSFSVKASGAIIDGWQRIIRKFKMPDNTITIGIELENNSSGTPVYFDDIRIHPVQSNVKSFIYDPETFKLMSELDENNYSTFYEYDNEGILVRVKKETETGIKTIQETRSGNVIDTKL